MTAIDPSLVEGIDPAGGDLDADGTDAGDGEPDPLDSPLPRLALYRWINRARAMGITPEN